MEKTKKYYLATLGCPKNEVDSEAIEMDLLGAGLVGAEDVDSADLVIINSCGFINDARVESLDTLFELHKRRKAGSILVLCGCLPARYNLEKSINEVDIFLPSDKHDRLIPRLKDLGWRLDVQNNPVKRIKPPLPYGYLRISEGCDNRCAYCAIPHIKGPFTSRPEAEIVREAEYLCSEGVRELILIGQDTTMYGRGSGNLNALPSLFDRLVSIKNCRWIRLMYAHPAHLDDYIIDAMAAHEMIVNYIDLPLQHISDRILRSMNRKIDRKGIFSVIEKIRLKIPGISLRTTFIVGFPGETDRNFRELLDFCEEIRFDHVGIFKYSPEESTPAEKFPDQVDEDISEERYLTLMDLQNRISQEKLKSHLGRTEKVLLHEVERNGTGYARAWFQAPEVDGQVIVKGCKMDAGGFVDVKYERSDSYDLISSIVESGNKIRLLK